MATTWALLISVFQRGGGVIHSTSALQEKGALCGPTKSICATETLHDSVLSYGKLPKLPISPNYPDRRQGVLTPVCPVH